MNWVPLCLALATGQSPASATTALLGDLGPSDEVRFVAAGRPLTLALRVSAPTAMPTNLTLLVRLWQEAGSLAAPVSAITLTRSNLTAGADLTVQFETEMPPVTEPTRFRLRWDLGQSPARHGHVALLALPPLPRERLSRLLAGKTLLAHRLPDDLFGWLKSQQVNVRELVSEEQPGCPQVPAILLAAMGSTADAQLSAVAPAKIALQRGIPAILIRPTEGTSSLLQGDLVHWHCQDPRAPNVTVPNAWESGLVHRREIQYQFVELLDILLGSLCREPITDPIQR